MCHILLGDSLSRSDYQDENNHILLGYIIEMTRQTTERYEFAKIVHSRGIRQRPIASCNELSNQYAF